MIIPLTAHLAAAVSSGSAQLRGADRSLRLAVGLLTKTLLQNLGALRGQPAFPKLWDATLQVRRRPCGAARSLLVDLHAL